MLSGFNPVVLVGPGQEHRSVFLKDAPAVAGQCDWPLRVLTDRLDPQDHRRLEEAHRAHMEDGYDAAPVAVADGPDAYFHEVYLSTGGPLYTTIDHELFTRFGWKTVGQICVGHDFVAVRDDSGRAAWTRVLSISAADPRQWGKVPGAFVTGPSNLVVAGVTTRADSD